MDGIIIINKEKNWTSNDVVQKVKHIFNEKVGHIGTLDPLATGVLPLLIGKGTLLSKYLINHNKEYIAKISLGKKTTTGDEEGEVIEKKEVISENLNKNKVQEVLNFFIGNQLQTPPIYSAIKVNGKKLYEYARKGESVNIKPRKIEIYNMELVSISTKNKEIVYKVNCSKGTYIRTLCEDIALKLGTVGYMKDLERTRVGDFDLKNAIKISEIEKYKSNFLQIEDFFKNNNDIFLNNYEIKRFINGVIIYSNNQDGIYKIYNESKFIGIGIVKNNKLKRDIVI